MEYPVKVLSEKIMDLEHKRDATMDQDVIDAIEILINQLNDAIRRLGASPCILNRN